MGKVGVNAQSVKKPVLPDARNENILVWVGGQLVPRAHAKLSPFDSAVQVIKVNSIGLYRGSKYVINNNIIMRLFRIANYLDKGRCVLSGVYFYLYRHTYKNVCGFYINRAEMPFGRDLEYITEK